MPHIHLGDADVAALESTLRSCTVLARLECVKPLDAPRRRLLNARLGRVERTRGRSLSGNNVGDAGALALARAVRGCPSLRSLRYVRRPPGPRSARPPRVLTGAYARRRRVFIGSRATAYGTLEHARWPRRSRTSRCWRSSSTDTGVAVVGTRTSPSLSSLTAHRCEPRPPISLDSNRIGDEGAYALAAAIRVHERLTSLSYAPCSRLSPTCPMPETLRVRAQQARDQQGHRRRRSPALREPAGRPLHHQARVRTCEFSLDQRSL